MPSPFSSSSDEDEVEEVKVVKKKSNKTKKQLSLQFAPKSKSTMEATSSKQPTISAIPVIFSFP